MKFNEQSVIREGIASQHNDYKNLYPTPINS